LIKCPIIIVFRVLAKTKEYQQNLNKNLKTKNHKKILGKKKQNEKKNLPNLMWSLAFKCFVLPQLHTQEGGRGIYQLQFKNRRKQ
jgi:hypothetical protein